MSSKVLKTGGGGLLNYFSSIEAKKVRDKEADVENAEVEVVEIVEEEVKIVEKIGSEKKRKRKTKNERERRKSPSSFSSSAPTSESAKKSEKKSCRASSSGLNLGKLRVAKPVPKPKSSEDSSEFEFEKEERKAKRRKPKIPNPKKPKLAETNENEDSTRRRKSSMKGKFLVAPENVRGIKSYFVLVGKTSNLEPSTSESAPSALPGSPEKNVKSDNVIVELSPAKSMLSVSSFEFEKEERRKSEPGYMEVVDSPFEDENCTDLLQNEEKMDEDSDEDSDEVFVRKGRSRTRKKLIYDDDDDDVEKESDSGVVVDSQSQDPVSSSQETHLIRRSTRIQKIQEQKEEQFQIIRRERTEDRKTKNIVDISTTSNDSVYECDSDNCSSDSDAFIIPKKKPVRFASIFLKGKDKEEAELLRLKQMEKETRIIDPAMLAFLHSGVPDAIVKSQKYVENKKEEDDFLKTVGFFPKFSHNIGIEHDEFLLETASLNWPCNLLIHQTSVTLPAKSQKFSGFVESEKNADLALFCCENFDPPRSFARIAKKFNILGSLSEDDDEGDTDAALPWIDKYAVKRKKNLLIDKTSLHKFEGWLSQWKRDIDDDGGISRKVVQKKRNSDSDSVVTSNEEGEFKQKSVVLCGPTGCGKTTLVNVMAQNLGFEVVEVNFSSRRPGKDVMQRVEEATLSHRLSDSAEVDESHCLILFKDIDLLYAEDDEGFHAAVAQLICASVRPIVMTTCHPCLLDAKIEKKDPLWIFLSYPQPITIVQRVLLPLFQSETEHIKYSETNLAHISSILESIVRHCNCDIRKSINQSQFMCNSRLFCIEQIHSTLSPSIKFDYIASRGSIQKEESNSNDSTLPKPKLSRAEKHRNIKELDHISRNLETLTDSDMISTSENTKYEIADISFQSPALLSSQLRSMLNTNGDLDTTQNVYKTLMFKNDNDIANEIRLNKLDEELCAYVDYPQDYDTKSYVRAIIKTSVINSIGRLAKRNGRVKGYFNRISPQFIQRISETFDFKKILDILKAAEADSL